MMIDCDQLIPVTANESKWYDLGGERLRLVGYESRFRSSLIHHSLHLRSSDTSLPRSSSTGDALSAKHSKLLEASAAFQRDWIQSLYC